MPATASLFMSAANTAEQSMSKAVATEIIFIIFQPPLVTDMQMPLPEYKFFLFKKYAAAEQKADKWREPLLTGSVCYRNQPREREKNALVGKV
ncbi:Uncharacterised protein [uncultured archaeon]|nr:Uncharacterised protein [uncultured archaeon]